MFLTILLLTSLSLGQVLQPEATGSQAKANKAQKKPSSTPTPPVGPINPDEPGGARERLQLASEVLTQVVQAPDKGIPEEVLARVKCIAVVPHLVKGGFVFGGKHGRGVATCRTADGWSAPAFISVGGGSWGLQSGVKGVDLIMLVMNDKGKQGLLSSKFQLSGEGSAAAGPVGRHASASTDWKLDTEMLTYSRSKGAFAGLTLEGAVIQQDSDSTTAVYGKDVTFKSILLGKVPTPEIARPFVQSVSTAVHGATAREANDDKK
jgi:lipid-binding SYLF domain-containing protein